MPSTVILSEAKDPTVESRWFHGGVFAPSG
jgi:hypothetical protein